MEFEVISKLLGENVSSFTGFIVNSLAGVVVVGTLAMAIVQAFKDLPFASFRSYFFESQFRLFLLERNKSTKSLEELEQRVCELVAGNKSTFYSKDLDGFVQELGAFRNVAIKSPQHADFKDFLFLFSEDVTNELINAMTPYDKQQVAITESHLTQLTSGHLEGFKTKVARIWKAYLHTASIVLSIAIIWMFAVFEDPILGAIYGILGGFVAPFAHNIVKVIKPS